MQPLEHLLARKALATLGQPPERLFAQAKRHLIDYAGVTIAGMAAPSVKAVRASFDGDVAPTAHKARLLGTGELVPWRVAAVVNGMAAHFHDYDDDEPYVAIAHPSSPVLSAALAVAEATNADVKRVLAAYVAGVETTMRLGAVINPGHYNSGWHATATLGTFGAAMAAGLLLDLPPAALVHALGLAASMSAGIKANFGSDGKPLQVGLAAGNGLWAADLAARGVVASAGALFGPTGFCTVYGGRADPAQIVPRFGEPFGLESPGFNVKLYPCCSSTHTAVDGLLDLRRTHAIAPTDIERIDAWIGEDIPSILIYDVPANGLQAKFSLRYCLAAAAQFGELTLDAFEDKCVTGGMLDDLIGRTHVHTDKALPRIATGVTHQSRVKVRTRAGLEVTREVADPLGSAKRPLSTDDLGKKFRTCARRMLDDSQAERAFTQLRAAESGPFRSLIDALCQEGRA